MPRNDDSLKSSGHRYTDAASEGVGGSIRCGLLAAAAAAVAGAEL